MLEANLGALLDFTRLYLTVPTQFTSSPILTHKNYDMVFINLSYYILKYFLYIVIDKEYIFWYFGTWKRVTIVIGN